MKRFLKKSDVVRVILVLFVIVGLMTIVHCENVFFPETGNPINSFVKRATPKGVVDQLIEAYELKRIDLLEDLLAEDFQFYVAPSFVQNYKANYSYFDPEKADTTMLFISSEETYYYYWKRKQELERTKAIFANTQSSEFTYPYEISNIYYTVSSQKDTIAAEIRLSYGVLHLRFSSGEDEYVDVDNQVFLLKKDIDGLWVIRKWYDLSNESSS